MVVAVAVGVRMVMVGVRVIVLRGMGAQEGGVGGRARVIWAVWHATRHTGSRDASWPA